MTLDVFLPTYRPYLRLLFDQETCNWLGMALGTHKTGDGCIILN